MQRKPQPPHPSNPGQSSENQGQGKPQHSGGWTEQEHGLFLQAIFTGTDDYKKIADVIKTRTESQVRSHAQKFFNRQKNEMEKIQNRILPEEYMKSPYKTRSRINLDGPQFRGKPAQLNQRTPTGENPATELPGTATGNANQPEIKEEVIQNEKPEPKLELETIPKEAKGQMEEKPASPKLELEPMEEKPADSPNTIKISKWSAFKPFTSQKIDP